MTLDELRSAVAKLTAPPGHDDIINIAVALGGLARTPTDPYFWLRALYVDLCVGAHGWHVECEMNEAETTVEQREERDDWQRLADAAYELLQEESGR